MKKFLIAVAVAILSVLLYLGFFRHPDVSVEKTDGSEAAAEAMMKEIVTSANEKGVTLYINDNKITEAEYQYDSGKGPSSKARDPEQTSVSKEQIDSSQE